MQSNAKQNLNIGPLPRSLPGVVCRQMTRCGNVKCRCRRGELHGPYYYRFWCEDGRMRKQYVPLSQVQQVTELCERRQHEQREAKAARHLAGEMTDSLKLLEKTIHGLNSTPVH
jgi:hypothetical protein